MSDMRIFENSTLGLKVRTILNEDGSISVNAEDAAIGFGWVKTEIKNGKEYSSIRWDRMNGYCEVFGFRPQVGENDYIPEGLFYLLGMKASNEAAQEFQKWLALDVLPTLRKTGVYEMGTVRARDDIGQIANVMREWRLWAQKQKMPYNQAMASMVKFLNTVGVPFPEEMIYQPPLDINAMQLMMNFAQE